jgi:hypothetical protein
MYIRIYVLESLAIMLIMYMRYSYTLDQSRYMIMRSGAYCYIGFSSAIYVYALVHESIR